MSAAAAEGRFKITVALGLVGTWMMAGSGVFWLSVSLWSNIEIRLWCHVGDLACVSRMAHGSEPPSRQALRSL